MTVLTTLEGDKIYLPGSGIYVDRDDLLSVRLHSYKDIVNNTPHLRYNTELHGIAEHMERENFYVGDDGIIYAVNPIQAETLAGGSEIEAVPIGFLDGDELGKGFKFKMPKFKLKNPFKKKKKGFMNSAGKFGTDLYRNFSLPGVFGKNGLIGRNIKGITNAFGKTIGGKMLGLGKKKGGFKMPGMDMETLMQIQEAQQAASAPAEELPPEEEQPAEEEIQSEEETQTEEQNSSPEEEQPAETDSVPASEEPAADEQPAEVGSEEALLSLAKTGASFLPGGGFITQAMDAGFGIHKQNQAKAEAKKAQNAQLLQMLVANTARPKPRPVVVKKPTVKKTPVIKASTRIETDQPVISNDPPANTSSSNTSSQTSAKKDGNSAMMMMGIGAVALLLIMKK